MDVRGTPLEAVPQEFPAAEAALEWALRTTGYARVHRLWAAAQLLPDEPAREQLLKALSALIGDDAALALITITARLTKHNGDVVAAAKEIVASESGWECMLAAARASGLDVYPPFVPDDKETP